MRVLITADAVGGVWSYAVELARALAPRGVDVHLATMGPRPSAAQRAAAAPWATLHESDFLLEWMDRPWGDVARAGDWLLALERTLAPDVVHLNGYAHGALPWRVPPVVVAHSCVCSWWRAVKGEDAPPAWDEYRRAVAAGVRAAAVLVAPTRTMLGDATRHHGAPARTMVVPNARRPDDYPPGEELPIVFTAGRLWDEAKNVDAVVRAAPAIPWRVYVAGAGAGARHVEPVSWLGRLEPGAVAAWMSRAAVYALPARYEPFGLSALEAGLAGCALVLGDIPSLREVWGDAAQYVDPDAPTALAATVRGLIDDPARRRAYAAAARARALEYSPARMADGYLAAYAIATGPAATGPAATGPAATAAVTREALCAS